MRRIFSKNSTESQHELNEILKLGRTAHDHAIIPKVYFAEFSWTSLCKQTVCQQKWYQQKWCQQNMPA